jgi:hypothetical protein
VGDKPEFTGSKGSCRSAEHQDGILEVEWRGKATGVEDSAAKLPRATPGAAIREDERGLPFEDHNAADSAAGRIAELISVFRGGSE